jgi:uncharacterized protein YcbK (DUF882 family)
MIYPHWSKVSRLSWQYSHFKPYEIACRHCGELGHDTDAMELLEVLRKLINKPMYITSGYRCPAHNAMVGGAPLSLHKTGQAFDIALTPEIDKGILIGRARNIGWGGVGSSYETFVHLDTGRVRNW